MKKQAFFRRADLLLIAVIAAVCIFSFFYLSNHPTHRRKTYKPYSIAAVWKSTASP